MAQWLSCSTGRSTAFKAASMRPTPESAQPPPIVVTVHQPRAFGLRASSARKLVVDGWEGIRRLAVLTLTRFSVLSHIL